MGETEAAPLARDDWLQAQAHVCVQEPLASARAVHADDHVLEALGEGIPESGKADLGAAHREAREGVKQFEGMPQRCGPVHVAGGRRRTMLPFAEIWLSDHQLRPSAQNARRITEGGPGST